MPRPKPSCSTFLHLPHSACHSPSSPPSTECIPNCWTALNTNYNNCNYQVAKQTCHRGRGQVCHIQFQIYSNPEGWRREGGRNTSSNTSSNPVCRRYRLLAAIWHFLIYSCMCRLLQQLVASDSTQLINEATCLISGGKQATETETHTQTRTDTLRSRRVLSNSHSIPSSPLLSPLCGVACDYAARQNRCELNTKTNL